MPKDRMFTFAIPREELKCYYCDKDDAEFVIGTLIDAKKDYPVVVFTVFHEECFHVFHRISGLEEELKAAGNQ